VLALPLQQQISDGNKENEASSVVIHPRLAKSVAVSKTTTKTAARTDKANTKKLTGREARHRIVAEVERLAVRDLCHYHAPTSHLLAAVAALGIDHAAMGNSATSRSVAAKRLSEHIASLSGAQGSGAGLTAFLVPLLPRFLYFSFALVCSYSFPHTDMPWWWLWW
jgi:hypothetical protein